MSRADTLDREALARLDPAEVDRLRQARRARREEAAQLEQIREAAIAQMIANPPRRRPLSRTDWLLLGGVVALMLLNAWWDGWQMTEALY